MKDFFSRLTSLFPGSEAVFDVASPLGVRVANKLVIKAGGMDESAMLKWGLKSASEMREWDDRITVLEEYPMFRKMKTGLSLKVRIRAFESDLLKIMSIVHLRFST